MGGKEEYIMALDTSLSNTGIAIFNTKKEPILITSIMTDSSESFSIRLHTIADGILNIAEKYSVKSVIAEKGFFRYVKSSNTLNRLLGAIIYVLEEYDIEFIASSSIKKCLTGRGNANKQEVQDAILRIYPDIIFENFDESDAVGVMISYFEGCGASENV